MIIYCCACKADIDAVLTTGTEIYPKRGDLALIPFWKCLHCSNFVGCHHKTAQSTAPLGCIPTPEIRKLRKEIHSVIDPLWKSKQYTRNEIYSELSSVFGKSYHTGEIRTVEQAIKILKRLHKLKEAK